MACVTWPSTFSRSMISTLASRAISMSLGLGTKKLRFCGSHTHAMASAAPPDPFTTAMGQPLREHCRHSSSAASPPLHSTAATGSCLTLPVCLLRLAVSSLVIMKRYRVESYVSLDATPMVCVWLGSSGTRMAAPGRASSGYVTRPMGTTPISGTRCPRSLVAAPTKRMGPTSEPEVMMAACTFCAARTMPRLNIMLSRLSASDAVMLEVRPMDTRSSAPCMDAFSAPMVAMSRSGFSLSSASRCAAHRRDRSSWSELPMIWMTPCRPLG